jgi:hypothetical protein
MSHFLTFLVWTFRKIRLRLLRREVCVTGRCLQCGRCCRNILLVNGVGLVRSKKQFQNIVENDPEMGRFHISGRDSSGNLTFTCDWLAEDNTCKDHENRLDLCRDFPSVSVYFRGGTTGPHCGFRFQEVKPFDKTLRRHLRLQQREAEDRAKGRKGGKVQHG